MQVLQASKRIKVERQLDCVRELLSELESLNCGHAEAAIDKLVGLGGLGMDASSLPAPLQRLLEQLRQRKHVDLRADSTSLAAVARLGADMPRLKYLKLSTCKIKQAPLEVFALPRLVSLSLVNNDLRLLPSAIQQLTRLTLLDVSYNRLARLPAALGALSRLESLYAVMNDLEHLPETFCNLTALSVCNLECNLLVDLPAAWDRMTSLRTLYVGNNKLQALPPALCALPNLTLK
jgi:Leucine-rich repeat (LRR) protein